MCRVWHADHGVAVIGVGTLRACERSLERLGTDHLELRLGDVPCFDAIASFVSKETQQVASLFNCEAEIAAPPHEGQGLDSTRVVDSMAAGSPPGSRKQADLFVVPNCRDRAPG